MVISMVISMMMTMMTPSDLKKQQQQADRMTPTQLRRMLRKRLEADQRNYLSSIPKAVPDGRVLVHNGRRIGSKDFRIWLALPDTPRLAVCDCGWAPELGPHFRMRRP